MVPSTLHKHSVDLHLERLFHPQGDFLYVDNKLVDNFSNIFLVMGTANEVLLLQELEGKSVCHLHL